MFSLLSALPIKLVQHKRVFSLSNKKGELRLRISPFSSAACATASSFVYVNCINFVDFCQTTFVFDLIFFE